MRSARNVLLVVVIVVVFTIKVMAELVNQCGEVLYSRLPHPLNLSGLCICLVADAVENVALLLPKGFNKTPPRPR